MQAANPTNGAGAGIAAGAGAATSTVVLFVLIALLAVLTVIGILWGMRLKARRRAAQEELEERAEEAENAKPDALVSPPPPFVPEQRRPPRPAPTAYDEPVAPDVLADEPIPAVTPTEDHAAARAAEPAPAPTDTGPSPADGPVTQLKGLGPKVAARLAELGITTVGQIAALDHDQAQALDARLGAFTGRMGRDRWIEQARFLAAGDVKGFEQVFGRL